MPSNLMLLNSPTRAVEVASVLRAAILDGTLRQGERVHEVDVAKRLGISRGPLREAFRLLEESGLIVSIPYRGSFIAQVTVADVLDVLAVRRLLETYAVTEAIARPGQELQDALRGAIGDMEAAVAAGDHGALLAAHGRFHGSFYRCSGNRVLERLWFRLEYPIRLYLPQSPAWHVDDLPDIHAPLLRTVEERDVPAAREEVRAHLEMTMSIRTDLEKSAAARGARPNAVDDQSVVDILVSE